MFIENKSEGFLPLSRVERQEATRQRVLRELTFPAGTQEAVDFLIANGWEVEGNFLDGEPTGIVAVEDWPPIDQPEIPLYYSQGTSILVCRERNGSFAVVITPRHIFDQYRNIDLIGIGGVLSFNCDPANRALTVTGQVDKGANIIRQAATISLQTGEIETVVRHTLRVTGR